MKSEVTKYRAVNFDLSLNLLRLYYPKKNILNAYKDIKSFMIKNGFSHRQWSGYRSNEKLSDRQVRNLMLRLRDELTWIDKCSTKIDVTNIEKIYDIKLFYSSLETDVKHKNVEKLFKDSEIIISGPARALSSLDTKISKARIVVEEGNAKNANKRSAKEISI